MDDNTHVTDAMLYSVMNMLGTKPKPKPKPKPNNGDYTFKVGILDEINFQKIADDLSYSDPLRIVELDGQHWAVVHHTISDKYSRSVMGGKYNEPPYPVHSAITMCVSEIKPSDIHALVDHIRMIKNAQWVWNNRRHYFGDGGKTVTVKKVKI